MDDPTDQPRSSPPPRIRRIDELCRRFEAAWEAGDRPAVEDFLGDAPESERPGLLRQLQALRARLVARRQRASDADCEDRSAAGEWTGPEYVPPAAPPVRIGPCGLERLLGEGGFGAATPAADDKLQRPVAVTIRQFVKNAIRSGLFSAAELSAFQHSLPPEQRPPDAQALARQLIQAGKLTKYQAAAVYQGKTKGLVLGEYVVMEQIGKGGMGQVYKARHRRMDRIVALKVLPRKAMQSREAIKRFHREVRAAAKLEHPNIVTAYDAGESHGIHFLVMQYVDGKDLAGVVGEHGPLPVEEAVDYVLQAAKGLEYAHSQGIVHRDIKPSNLLLDKNGTVTILDMGLARMHEKGGPMDDAHSESLTISGQVMGTWQYMAPEQAEDTHLADHRADIYALGCTLYRLLTAKAPYQGGTPVQILYAHRDAPIPSLCHFRPDVPLELDTVFQKMVAKSPEDRYESMTELIAALKCCVADGEPASQTAIAGASSDTALTSFLQGLAEQAAAAKETPPPVAQATVSAQAASETDKGGRRKMVPVDRRQIPLLAGIAAGMVFLVVLLFGVTLRMKTSHGTLVLEINEPDALVEVLDEEDKVEITRRSEKGKLSISVDPGTHRLKVEKDGFQLYTQGFTIEEGGTTSIRARLEPLRDAAESKATLSQAVKPSSSTESPWKPSEPVPAIAPFTSEGAKQHQDRWAKHLGVPVVTTNSTGMQMVLIPPGEFFMGSTEEEITRRIEELKRQNVLKRHVDEVLAEGLRHRVRIAKPYYLGKHEVTIAQFRRFVEATQCRTDAEGDGEGGHAFNAAGEEVQDPKYSWRSVHFTQGDSHPVGNLSWNDAVRCCQWLSSKEGKRYRLPTEAEWEYACRAGSTTAYCFGDEEPRLYEYAWIADNSGLKSNPVGGKLPNAWGLHDMHGNMEEWSQDWFDARFYGMSPLQEPKGPDSGNERVLRGGNWYFMAFSARSAARGSWPPRRQLVWSGFRVLLEIQGTPSFKEQVADPDGRAAE